MTLVRALFKKLSERFEELMVGFKLSGYRVIVNRAIRFDERRLKILMKEAIPAGRVSSESGDDIRNPLQQRIAELSDYISKLKELASILEEVRNQVTYETFSAFRWEKLKHLSKPADCNNIEDGLVFIKNVLDELKEARREIKRAIKRIMPASIVLLPLPPESVVDAESERLPVSFPGTGQDDISPALEEGVSEEVKVLMAQESIPAQSREIEQMEVALEIQEPLESMSALDFSLCHSDEINCISFSPDDRYIISAGRDGMLILWDVEAPGEVVLFEGHCGSVNAVAFIQDGAYIISGGEDGALRKWNTATGGSMGEIGHHDAAVRSIAISPDGAHILSADNSGRLILWDIASGTKIKSVRASRAAIRAIAFHRYERWALSGSDEGLLKWSIPDLNREFGAGDYRGPVNAIAISPGGGLAYTIDNDGEVIMNAVRSNLCSEHKRLRLRSVESILYDGGDIVCGTICGEVLLLRGGSEEDIEKLKGHSGPVRAIAAAHNSSRFATAGADRTVRIWGWARSEHREEAVFGREMPGVSSIALSIDGRYLLAGGSTVRLWELQFGREMHSYGASSGSHQIAELWSIPEVNAAFILTWARDGTVATYHLATGDKYWKPDDEERKCTSPMTALASIDVLYALSGHEDGTIRKFNKATGEEEFILEGHNGPVNSLDIFSTGNCAISGGSDGTIRIWNTVKRMGEHVLRGHSGRVRVVACDPHANSLASGGDDCTVQMWVLAWPQRWETKSISTGHEGAVISLAYSPDGFYLLSGSNDHTVKLWEPMGRLEMTFRGHRGPVTCVAFTHDGRHAVSGSLDGRIIFWNIASGQPIMTLSAFDDGTWAAIVCDGYFNCAPGGERNLRSRIENRFRSLTKAQFQDLKNPMEFNCSWHARMGSEY